MANNPTNGKRYVFGIDLTNTGASYDTVVCLTSNTFERSASVIDASSKCGTAKLNGVKDRTITLEGNVIFNPDANNVSEGVLNDAFENDTPFAWFFGPEAPLAGEDTYTGVDALISALTMTAGNDAALSFSGTVQLNGVPVRTTEGS
jgi:predicted secreted protein